MGSKRDKVRVTIVGRENFYQFWDMVREVKYGTLSPGGAAQLLRVSRQTIHELCMNRKVNSWAYYEVYGKVPAYVEISLYDLISHAYRSGRLRRPEQAGLGVPLLKEILTTVREENRIEEVEGQESESTEQTA